MSTVILDTITGKSTATTITIGSTPVVSASANSMTIRGEGSNQTSIQQGLAKAWNKTVKDGTGIEDSFNISSLTDTATGKQFHTTTNNMANDDYSMQLTPVDDNIEQVWCDGVTAAGFLSNSYGASAFEDEKHSVTVHGDLA